MQAKLCIKLRERGSPQVVSREEWETAGCISETTELVRMGVIKVTQSSSYLLIEPKTLVGVFDSPRFKLEVTPKSPGMSAELLRRLDDWRKEVRVDDVLANGAGSQVDSVWKTFETLISDVHREGMPWAYARQTEISSTPRGRILFRETLAQLASRGINHQIVSSVLVRKRFDRFAPALYAVRRHMAVFGDGSVDVRSRVDRLIALVGDVSLSISNVQAKDAFNELTEVSGRPALQALSLFCQNVLNGDDSARTSERVGSGTAEFVDLEKLWENAIHMLLEQHMVGTGERVVLHPLRRRRLTLFDDGGPLIDPDIVCFRGPEPLAVVDAKYSIATSPTAADVYQLSSYLSRLKCKTGILAYVSENNETAVQRIGTLDGQKLFAAYLTLDAFDPERRVLDDIFLPEKSIVQMV